MPTYKEKVNDCGLSLILHHILLYLIHFKKFGIEGLVKIDFLTIFKIDVVEKDEDVL